MSEHGEKSGFQAAHDAACSQGEASYLDPETGLRVFSALGLKKRGKCCGFGCRHCPFSHQRVRDRTALIKQPAYLNRRQSALTREASRGQTIHPRHVLFWSGGKDSFLALRAWLRSAQTESRKNTMERLDSISLLTTFDADTRMIPHQQVPLSSIVRQAQALNLDLVGVPLHAGSDYVERLQAGLSVLKPTPLGSLLFGDLHLEHIRTWRDKHLAPLNTPHDYPLWDCPQEELLVDLQKSGVPCVITTCAAEQKALTGEVLSVGEIFDEQLFQRALKFGWDGFGENGEFHTLAEVWKVPVQRALGDRLLV